MAVGTGDKFRAYVISRNMHANLLAQLDSLNSLANEAVSSALIAEAPEQYIFNKFVYNVAALCHDVQAGKADADKAIEYWIMTHQTNFARTAATHFRQLVTTGGRPAKPELDALYAIGLPIFQKHAGNNTIVSSMQEPVFAWSFWHV